jgi:hypothetical protein
VKSSLSAAAAIPKARAARFNTIMYYTMLKEFRQHIKKQKSRLHLFASYGNKPAESRRQNAD